MWEMTEWWILLTTSTSLHLAKLFMAYLSLNWIKNCKNLVCSNNLLHIASFINNFTFSSETEGETTVVSQFTWIFNLSTHSFPKKKMAYQEVLKQGFLISNVENCVSTVNNIKWFWGIICCCYVSNHKFNLKTQRTTWKFSAWATKFTGKHINTACITV